MCCPLSVDKLKMNLNDFLSEWNSARTTLTVHTSGSTGVPKAIEVEKTRMRASARMTCRFLGLKEGDTALLCMPLRYIAGMMMVVRAEEVGMRLLCVEPDGHPLASCNEHVDFGAMVPLQVWNSLQVPEERERLKDIGTLIIGGGALDVQLEDELKTFPNRIYATYGMTETLSHIAMRRVGEPWFYTLPGISIHKDENDCLVIDAPSLTPSTLFTHDIVEFNEDGGFKIKGRIDNVICSGGIKIQIEEVEAFLHPLYGDTIQVTSHPHPKFGEEVVYLTTQPIDEALLRSQLPNPYWFPKQIIQVDELPKTATGKPDRARAKKTPSEG